MIMDWDVQGRYMRNFKFLNKKTLDLEALLGPGAVVRLPMWVFESIQYYTTSQNFQEFGGKQLASEKVLLHWWLKQAVEFCFS